MTKEKGNRFIVIYFHMGWGSVAVSEKTCGTKNTMATRIRRASAFFIVIYFHGMYKCLNTVQKL